MAKVKDDYLINHGIKQKQTIFCNRIKTIKKQVLTEKSIITGIRMNRRAYKKTKPISIITYGLHIA